MVPTSGGITGNVVSDGSEYSYMNWQLASQDQVNNRSLINWQFGWHFTTYSCRGLRNGEAWVNGNAYYYNHNSGDGVHQYNSAHEHRPALQISSGSVWIGHDSAGNATLSLATTLTGFSGYVSTGSGSFALPQIPRQSSPPSTPTLSSVNQNSMRAQFTDAGDGAPVDSRQLSYSTGTDPDAGTIIASDGDDVITGLSNGTTYHVWARTHNVAGYSGWSGMATATTWRVPDGPDDPTITGTTQVQTTINWNPPGFDGGTAVTGYDIAYNTTNSTTGATIITGVTSPYTKTALTPGTKYWFFVRAKNAVGNGFWSNGVSVTMIAGARVNVGGVWKQAVPYVRVAGVWKVARPWSRVLGTWKEST
jgi:fibronectin type III domain protein